MVVVPLSPLNTMKFGISGIQKSFDSGSISLNGADARPASDYLPVVRYMIGLSGNIEQSRGRKYQTVLFRAADEGEENVVKWATNLTIGAACVQPNEVI